MNELREALAAECHEIWIHWMKYMTSKMYEVRRDNQFGGPDQVLTCIETEAINRWRRHMVTSYSDLTEKEKESDRNQADKLLAVYDRYVFMEKL